MNRLKELRKEKKLSQKQIALELDTPLRTYQRWENDETQIKPDKAQILADYFGVSVGYLLGYNRKEELVSKSQELVDITQEVFYSANSIYKTNTEGIIDVVDLLIKGIEEESLTKEPLLVALQNIKELVSNIDENVKEMLEYQAKYTATQIMKERLKKAVTKNT